MSRPQVEAQTKIKVEQIVELMQGSSWSEAASVSIFIGEEFSPIET